MKYDNSEVNASGQIHSSNEEVLVSIEMPKRHREWSSLEAIFAGILGLVLIWFHKMPAFSNMSVLASTIMLVIFLSGLMGIREIPFPNKIFGKQIRNWMYPIVGGILSMFMDSFLVLLLVVGAELDGKEVDKIRFRALITLAALIGGLGTYFGEVYQLPLALTYNMHEWHSMLPVFPPIILYLTILGILCSRIKVKVGRVVSMGEEYDHSVVHKGGHEPTWDDYAVLAVFIAALLVFHNPILVLGLLCVFAYVFGEAENLINVITTKTEVAVMLLLFIALIVSEPLAPYLAQLHPAWLFVGGVVNGVLLGAVYPASGDVWWDTTILSTAVQITPISSLVGIIVFRKWRDWIEYMKISLPMALLWFVSCLIWFSLVWPSLAPTFYQYFSAPYLK